MKMKVKGHFLRSEIVAESSFLMQWHIITIVKKLGAFKSELKKSKKKNLFPFVFPQMDLANVGVIFTSER